MTEQSPQGLGNEDPLGQFCGLSLGLGLKDLGIFISGTSAGSTDCKRNSKIELRFYVPPDTK